MRWYQEPWIAQLALPAASCAVVTWISLVRRFTGKGRLFGSRQAVGLALSVTGMTCVIALGTGLLLPHVARLPPVAVGLVAGAGVAPRGRRDGDVTQPVVKVLTLGVASLLERLEYRLITDYMTWADSFMSGFKEPRQLRVFAHDLKLHLLSRHEGNKALTKVVNERHTEVDGAVGAVFALLDARVRRAGGGVLTALDVDQEWPGGQHEEIEYLRAFGVALERCKQLLALAHVHGRRSDMATLEALRDRVVPSDGFGSSSVPVQRGLFGLVRGERG
ncbi:hypothetical protein K7472_20445 [Streptomyces sp. PTM05]|uniref:Uncharacterized protein n=1 Tax=Streptantibioticus parmotrematis TaxID=2873249 RepID=A0ABS7QVF8_9ACTN|nr:hypothetical protein [Streptantibioticus parmotrematis]MBY8887200.1 hypothetical protein [Streptantibioticus parmotrematis]